MITSLALIFLVGLLMAGLCRRLECPGIVGMLAAGILLGPYVLNWLDPSVLAVSGELRKMALIVILIKAGLSLDLKDLRRVGRPALLLSFLPASAEILAFVLFAPMVLGVTRMEGAVMGAVLGAVSPAVVVPRMVALMEEGYGAERSVPQMILAGASMDDVFVIVLFTSFLGMAQGGGASVAGVAVIPVSILTGLLLGGAVGWMLSCWFEGRYRQGEPVRSSIKAVLVLSLAFLLVSAEGMLEGTLPLSGLLAVMGMACLIRAKSEPPVTARLAEKFGKLWLAAEVLLFVLVGAAVDIRYTLEAGPRAVLMIALSLGFRTLAVLLCTAGAGFTRRERAFCVISYLPKATVQAAIGSVPLSAGLSCGPLVLSVAVLAILITAPLGAWGIDRTGRLLLDRRCSEGGKVRL